MLLLSHRGQQVQQDRPVLPDLQDLRALTQLLLDQPVQRALQALLDQQDPQVLMVAMVQMGLPALQDRREQPLVLERQRLRPDL